jgi:hypothetical protein
MVITKDYARFLIRHGKASYGGLVNKTGRYGESGKYYMIVIRHDKQRTDHYFVEER